MENYPYISNYILKFKTSHIDLLFMFKNFLGVSNEINVSAFRQRYHVTNLNVILILII